MRNALSRVPLFFEANRGQADEAVEFVARQEGYTLFLTATEAVFAVPGSRPVRFRLVDAAGPALEGLEPLPTRVNHFRGNDPAQWRTDVPTYRRVAHREAYPGIGPIYYGKQGQLEFDFVVAPGAEPEQIEFAFDGVDSLEATAEGALVLQAPSGSMRSWSRWIRPAAWSATPRTWAVAATIEHWGSTSTTPARRISPVVPGAATSPP